MSSQEKIRTSNEGLGHDQQDEMDLGPLDDQQQQESGQQGQQGDLQQPGRQQEQTNPSKQRGSDWPSQKQQGYPEPGQGKKQQGS